MALSEITLTLIQLLELLAQVLTLLTSLYHGLVAINVLVVESAMAPLVSDCDARNSWVNTCVLLV